MITLERPQTPPHAGASLLSPVWDDADRCPVAAAYTALRHEATRLAGAPEDIAPRVALLHGLYLQSHGNHTFPEVALHGALWAHGAVRLARTMAIVVRLRYGLEARRRALHLAQLQDFLEGLLAINRQVFIDTYTTYYFTQRFGRDPAATAILDPALCTALTAMHDASHSGTILTPEEKRCLFLTCLQYEQDTMVAPRIDRVVARFHRPVLRTILLRPVVRFAYFPRRTYVVFHDFSDKEERIRHAVRSYDLAAAVGWPAVAASLRDYGVMPDAFFDDPLGYGRDLTRTRGAA